MEVIVLIWRLQKLMKNGSAAPYLLEGQVQREDKAGKGEIIRLKHKSRCER